MILTAHQPVYLPWLGLFHKIELANEFVSFNQVQYLPKDWNNRNYINNGVEKTWLTLPVLRSNHRDKVLTEIQINNDTRWNIKHWRSLKHFYGKTKYFSRYSDFFEHVYLKKTWDYLVDINEYMLKWFLSELSIKTKFIDARSLNLVGYKSDLVLDMCKKLKAKTYVFGEKGLDYANQESFEKNGIKVIFQNYCHPTYTQTSKEFIKNLSIVDLLFNHEKKKEIFYTNI